MTTVRDLMDRAPTMIAEDPDRARKFGGVYKFALDGEGDGPSSSTSPTIRG